MMASTPSPSTEDLAQSLNVFRALPSSVIQDLIASNDMEPHERAQIYMKEFQHIKHGLICPRCAKVNTLRSEGTTQGKYFYVRCKSCTKSSNFIEPKSHFIAYGQDDLKTGLKRKSSFLTPHAATSQKRNHLGNQNSSRVESFEIEYENDRLATITNAINNSPTTKEILKHPKTPVAPTTPSTPSPLERIPISSYDLFDEDSTIKINVPNAHKQDNFLNNNEELVKFIVTTIVKVLDPFRSQMSAIESKLHTFEDIFFNSNDFKPISTTNHKQPEPTRNDDSWSTVASKNSSTKYVKKQSEDGSIVTVPIRHKNQFDVLKLVDPETKVMREKTIEEIDNFLTGVDRQKPTELETIKIEGIRYGKLSEVRSNIALKAKIHRKDIYDVYFPGDTTCLLTVNKKVTLRITENFSTKDFKTEKVKGCDKSLIKDPTLSDSQKEAKAAEMYRKNILSSLNREERKFMPRPLIRFQQIAIKECNSKVGGDNETDLEKFDRFLPADMKRSRSKKEKLQPNMEIFGGIMPLQVSKDDTVVEDDSHRIILAAPTIVHSTSN